MSERDQILAGLAPREERVTLNGVEIAVRELSCAADVAALRDETDATWKLVVRSAFKTDGTPLFTDADIPALKAGSLARTKRLVDAVMRVNGEALEDEVKNSSGGPATA